VLGGNFRDENGGCYVWLNLARAPLLNGQEICKIALHEMGHLTGLQHSPDIDDVMYAPFRPQPVPDVCTAPIGAPGQPA
jgi:Matrixin